MIPLDRVGALVRLKEPDYCYGLGDSVLRVTEVPDALTEPDWGRSVAFKSVEQRPGRRAAGTGARERLS
jgi:hypothetical protein